MEEMKPKQKAKLNYTIRGARKTDLDVLESLEKQSFDYDRLSRKNFSWMLTKAHALFLVLEVDKKVIGYGLVLLNTGTRLARLYSLALSKAYKGRGLGKALLEALIEKAQELDYVYLRLEVKESNHSAIGLYENMGFRVFSKKDDYYSDGSTALCFEKRILFLKKSPKLSVPYYQQSLNFTCGPACLMMALKKFKTRFKPTISDELQIWREATTIFMTSGHGGCGPRGLALAAKERGLHPELYLSHQGVLFEDTVRSVGKKDILKVVNQDFVNRTKKEKIKVYGRKITISDIKETLKANGLVMALITTFHFDRSKVPHWVLITAIDDRFVYFHDPDISEVDKHEAQVDRLNVPVSHKQFLRMFKFGKQRMSLAVALYK
jgi:ribosomal-protein-alanine acetyltransferase